MSANARASRRISSCIASSASFLAHGGTALRKLIFFTATARASRRPIALTTEPKPPLPSVRSSR